jgi:hypothetical protein
MNISTGVFISIACQGEVGTGVENTGAPSLSAADYNVGTTVTVSLGTWTGATALAGSLRYVSDDTEIDTFTADGTYDLADADFGQELYLYVVPDGNAAAAVASAAVGPVVYAYGLQIEFATDDAAPITSPYAGETGELTFGATTNVSASGSALLIEGTTAITAQSGTISRLTGLAMCARTTRITTTADNRVYVAFGNSNANGLTLGSTSSTGFMEIDGAFRSQRELAEDTAADITIVARAAGYAYFVDEVLEWITDAGTTDPVRAYLARDTNRAHMQIGHLRARRLGGVWDSDEGIASVNVASPVNGAIQEATADTIAEFTFALAGSPSAGDEVSLDYRIQDASNKWRAILKRNVGNTAWDFRLRTVTAGVEATPAGWTDVTGVGTPTRIRVMTKGNLHNCFTRSGSTYTARGAQITSSYLATEPDIAAVYAAGTTSTALKAYPRTHANYDGVSF